MYEAKQNYRIISICICIKNFVQLVTDSIFAAFLDPHADPTPVEDRSRLSSPKLHVSFSSVLNFRNAPCRVGV